MSANCQACDAKLKKGLAQWHLECPRCGYESSDLQGHIQSQREGGDLDEEARERSLESLRRRNFSRIRETIETHIVGNGERKTLLDVGCAHGWFLEACADMFDVVGIEPDMAVSKSSSARGLSVRTGFFPQALQSDERFDVIAFNDVLEHIPDLDETLSACRHHLNDSGLLVVNAPSRHGVFYQLSKVLARVGIHSFFDRMWQKGFPSPHVHYFDTASITLVAKRHGFTLESRSVLSSFSVDGLYSRIKYSKDISSIKALAIAAVVTIASPLVKTLPADINVWVFRRHQSAN